MSQYLDLEWALASSWITTKRLDGRTNRVGHATQANNLQVPGRVGESAQILLPSESYKSRVCITSLCGGYCAIAFGLTISTYNIEGDTMMLVNQIECEATVLAISVDASPGRLALAALLEGRIGTYNDLLGNATIIQESSP